MNWRSRGASVHNYLLCVHTEHYRAYVSMCKSLPVVCVCVCVRERERERERERVGRVHVHVYVMCVC